MSETKRKRITPISVTDATFNVSFEAGKNPSINMNAELTLGLLEPENSVSHDDILALKSAHKIPAAIIANSNNNEKKKKRITPILVSANK